ncbi:Phosphoribosylaminoimidazole-succinocarboxamide synthase [Polystyrenella longa]|uniref:Phosphoribosylaminoimidazole-succinocarboxamide synthase n=1 Tax=Polystyrenella longa TaxID=2528007 RepID=A0A518CRD7_9PLAN|nr:phosphoribosylaminoimidazolesuccinocarboxamide synthase [Polystyrenella longa]QDU81775.1 Phosphoribosylaminoimidazole-succinocarboxamide synthase [Polystyrenella longa]
MSSAAFVQSNLTGIPVKRGKVRDVYDFGDRLLFVATDRISAFDWIMPNGIPDKGRVLTGISKMWFDRLEVSNHLLSMNPADLDLPTDAPLDALIGRSMVVRKTEVVPIECVVRGYLSGSGWKEYREQQTVCGIELPAGLQESAQLPEPIFTPATKAESGHDENIPFKVMCDQVGNELSEKLRSLSFEIYQKAASFAQTKGIILADTKFEFGLLDGEIILIDEVLTPDSSRFWPMDTYKPGGPQFSFDKQFVRDWLESTDWDKNSEPPTLPEEIVTQTRAKYIEAYELLTGEEFGWK